MPGPLKTGQTVHWKIRSKLGSKLWSKVKAKTEKFTEWSEAAMFTVQLSGPPELPNPLFLPVSEAPRLSSFECSDPNLNKIFELAAERLHEVTSVRDIGLAIIGAFGGGVSHWADQQLQPGDLPGGAPSKQVRVLFLDSKAALWVGTSDGKIRAPSL